MIKIYEVMAIEHNLPLFFLEHLKRFKTSINTYKEYSLEQLDKIVVALIQPMLNESNNMNIKITYCVQDDHFSIIKTMPRKPNRSLYITGASTGLYYGERVTPLIKQEHSTFRDITDSICEKMGYYDLFLINTKGEITEGSRSNFLLIDKDNRILTSPIGDALNGITRSIIFDICRSKGIEVIETQITKEVIFSAVSLIITGTSPEILPVSICETNRYAVEHTVISTLQDEFLQRKLKDQFITKEFFNL